MPTNTAPITAEQDQERTLRPPRAKVEVKATEIHGDRLSDDYFWLRQRNDAEVLAYLQAENAYTEQMTGHTEELRQRLYVELVGRIEETDLSVPWCKGDYFYYSRTEEGRQYPIHCRKRGGLEADEEIILDVNQLAEGHEFFRVGSVAVSPDHRLLAYATDTKGTEHFTLVVKRLADGKLLSDRVENVYYSLEWGNDNRTLFYTTLDHARRPYKVFRHVLGTAATADVELFHEADAAFTVGLGKARSDKYLLLAAGSSTTSEYHILDADQPMGDFEVFQPRRHEVRYSLEHHVGVAGESEGFYVRTNDGAKNFRLLWAPVGSRDRASWSEVIAHREHVKLEAVSAFRQYLVLTERHAGLRRLRVRHLASGEDHQIELPESVSTVWPSFNPEFDTDQLRFTYMSMVTPRSVYDYDLGQRSRRLLKRQQVPSGYDSSLYTTERIYARAEDGLAVPISLVYRRDLVRNGSHPALLYGYGSYGSGIDPYFSSNRLSLLDRGWVYAVAHVRGGGVLGERWHDDGKMLNKRNTFSDFIAAAELLLDQRYTSTDRLAIQGGSAGGLLMGAVVNMRPDLFAAVIADVPFVDVINTMLDSDIPLTVGEFEEWGNPAESVEHYRYMKSYSPYDNVVPQDYPPMLITAGLNDSRVQYWEPAKWTAKLRATKTDVNLLLLKTNMGAGHSGASGRYDSLREIAFDYAFLVDTIDQSMASSDCVDAEASTAES